VHEGGSRKALRARALELLQQVEIPDPQRRLEAFPHQLSGGMSQRVMIALAIACNPCLLIADEPTTALDVTVQTQVLDLLLRLHRERGMGLMLITHDLGVIAETAHRVVVMYAGQVMEICPVPEIFTRPQHPYTAALMSALPENNVGRERLQTIAGVVPGAYDRPRGCLLAPRCKYAVSRCQTERPSLNRAAHGEVRCFFPLEASVATASDLNVVTPRPLPPNFFRSNRWPSTTRCQPVSSSPRRLSARLMGSAFSWMPEKHSPWWVNPVAARRRWRAAIT